MKAEQAIKQIKSETIELFGQTPFKHNHPWGVRNELQKMAESNRLSPKEYYKALKLTWLELTIRMSGPEIDAEMVN